MNKGSAERNDEPIFEVVWPQSPQGVHGKRPADRLDTLNGKRIGFLWDYMFRGEEIFPALERELTSRFAGIEIVGYDIFGNTHGPDESQVVGEIPNTIAARGVDAVVSGVGC